MGYSKNALTVRELGQVFFVLPTDRILIEGLSATNEISVADFVNSYSTVYYNFALSSNGDLYMTLFTANSAVSATDLGRVRPVWKGAFNAASTYIPNDIVYSDGSAYIAILSSVNVTPVSGTSQWDLMVQGFVPGATLNIINNIAALRNFDTTLEVDGSVVYLPGYYTANDRGGGRFIWVAASTQVDDSGRYIRPTAISSGNPGRWHRLLDGDQANVKMWGAKGDATTNDTTAIQAAINALEYGWSLDLLFPTGTYKVTSVITLPARIHVHGEGLVNNTVVQMTQGTAADIFTTTNTFSALSSTDYDVGFLFENITLAFDGYQAIGTTNTTNVALTLTQPSVSHVIRNVTTLGGAHGIQCFGLGSPGLRLQNVACNYSFAAPVRVRGLSAFPSDFNQINIDGLSFISKWNSAQRGIWIDNIIANVAVRNLEAEGNFASGVIAWSVPALASGETVGQLLIHSATVKGDGGALTPFVRLQAGSTTNPLSAGGQQVPSVYVGSVNLSNCSPIVQDLISNYTVNNTGVSGLQTGEARVPFTYEASGGNDDKSNIKIQKINAGTATTTFSATSAGWYRIASGVSRSLIGNFTIASSFESTNFDVVVNEKSTNGIFTVHRHSKAANWNALPFVTKARAVYYQNNNCYLDVYLNSVPGLSSVQPRDQFITITHKVDGRSGGTLCVPCPIETTLSAISALTEVEFDNGFVQTGGNANTPHLKVGENHLWFAADKSLRHFNSGVDVIIVAGPSDTTGTGASAKAFFNNGALSYITVTSQGSGYTVDPFAYIIPGEMNNGSGATLSARTTGNNVTTINILAAGSGYGARPTEYSGRKYLTDFDVGQARNTSQSLRVCRRLKAVKQVSLTTPAANSRIVTGTNLLNDLFVGDRYQGPDSNVYEIAAVIDNTTAVLATPYPTKVTNATYSQVSWLVFPALSGFKYNVTYMRAWTNNNPSWSGASWTRISLRLKGAATIFTIASIPKADLDASSGNGLNNAGALQSANYIAPNQTFSPDTPDTGRNTGVGQYLNDGIGVALDYVDNNGNFVRPTAGSADLFIEVLGFKIPSNSNY